MKTEQDSTANQERPTALPPAPGSEAYYEIGLVGGTVLRIHAGRGKDCAYDHLLAALEGSKTYDDEKQEWQGEWMRYAKKIRLDEVPPSPPNDQAQRPVPDTGVERNETKGKPNEG
jgi:hypothetical protein